MESVVGKERSEAPGSSGIGAAARSDAHAAWLALSHFPSLDGLRCLSILPVIWHHSTPRPLAGPLGRGPLGVDLFFAISGFLITTLLLREQRATGTVSIRKFYLRRSLRIFPLYYAVLGLYVVRALALMPASPMRAHFLRSLPWYATYTANWFVDFAVPHPVVFAFAWSLATEEQFYLVWPTVLKLSRRWWAPVAFMLLLIAADQLAERGMLVSVIPWDSVATRVITSIATPICLGALLAYALDRPTSHRWVRLVLGQWWSAPAALAALAALISLEQLPITAVHLAMTALVGAVSIRRDHGLHALTNWAPVRHVGAVSYGAYLLHVSAITAIKGLLPAGMRQAPVVFVLATAVTIVAASLAYRYFERPFLQLRDRFRAQAR